MKYNYKAIKGDVMSQGKLEADSEDKAIAYLRAKNFIILQIKAESVPLSALFSNFFSRVSFSDIVEMTRQYAIMLASGLTIVDSLDILKKQAKKPSLLKLLKEIEDDIKSGLSLSTALKKRPELFSNLYIALVKAGEASGKLDEILMKLAGNLERQRSFRSKLKAAMIYPAIVVTAMFAVMFIMISFVIPKLLTVYKDFNVKLPAPTLFLIFVSDFFQAYWYLVLIGIALLVIAVKKYYSSRIGKRTIDSLMLRIPLINRVIKIGALVDTTRTLSILIGAGVSILEALDIVAETSTNIVYQEAFMDINKKIEKGETLGRALEETGIFPPILVQMTAVGEQTGHLDDTLGHLADYFESESEIAVKALTTLIEPSILIVLGISVGFVVMAVIIPMFSLSASF